MTLWSGRFDGGPADDLLAFTGSLATDIRLAADDLAGWIAHIAPSELLLSADAPAALVQRLKAQRLATPQGAALSFATRPWMKRGSTESTG